MPQTTSTDHEKTQTEPESSPISPTGQETPSISNNSALFPPKKTTAREPKTDPAFLRSISSLPVI